MNREECFSLMKKVHINQKVELRSAAQQNAGNPASMDAVRLRQNNPMAFVQLGSFIYAIEMVLNDIKLDPYILVYKLLLTFYSG